MTNHPSKTEEVLKRFGHLSDEDLDNAINNNYSLLRTETDKQTKHNLRNNLQKLLLIKYNRKKEKQKCQNY